MEAGSRPPDKPQNKDAEASHRYPPDPYVVIPKRVLGTALVWTIALVALFLLYEEIRAFETFFPTRLGPLPFTSIWFGAAGGLLISLQGIFAYNRRWRRSYDYWHYLRPVLGAFMGTLGCLVFIVLNQAATTKHQPANGVFYAVLAFVLGYREQSFRALVTRLIDTIILPPDKPPPSKVEPSTPDTGSGP